ncbi:hypothetical protein BaRGS_00016672 [Batillaria attramentaria]|uniref:Uncharacterized protein n=1 Tax=Batillaria attramentaria TaxID=370345 RepID=A0ABD0KXJ6_9CAEN
MNLHNPQWRCLHFVHPQGAASQEEYTVHTKSCHGFEVALSHNIKTGLAQTSHSQLTSFSPMVAEQWLTLLGLCTRIAAQQKNSNDANPH